jgi:hypothetical protein
MMGKAFFTVGCRTKSRTMPMGSLSAVLATERAKSLLRSGVPLATMEVPVEEPSEVVNALLLVPSGLLSVALAVAMVFS